MLTNVYNSAGTVTGQIELNDKVFGVEPRQHAMHMDVVAHLANRRQGTKQTKVRSEVSGSGKKPFRQKGTGGARRGERRSPLSPGGGTVHGPKPIDYRISLPRKMKQVARKSALTVRAQASEITVLEGLSLGGELKTKPFYEMLISLNLTNTSVLVLIPSDDAGLYLASRNIPNLKLDVATRACTYDILRHRRLLLFKDAIKPLEAVFVNE